MSKITVLEMNDITKSAHVHNITAVLLDLGYEVNLIGFNADKISEPMRSNPSCHTFNIVGKTSKNFVDNIFKKIEKRRLLKQTFKICMEDSICVWVASLAGFIPLKREIIKYNNVVRVAELIKKLYVRDRFMGRIVFRRIPIEKEIVQAQRIVVPEINRAHIHKIWWNLQELPAVLPNKPYNMKTGKLPENLLEAVKKMKEETKKIILYMGVIGPDRNIEDFARALSNSDEYAFYLAGNVLPYARNSLKRTEQLGGKYLGAFNRPGHFELIKYAHIGAMPYVPTSNGNDSELNALYCAPNKIFEYAGYEVPMIGSDVIGLKVPFEKWKIGECCSNQPEDILRAIKYVEKHYDSMKKNCIKFYNSVDIKENIKGILSSIGIVDGKQKTKILMTVPDLLFAGIQTFVVNLIQNLDSERYQIDLYVYKKFENTYESYLKSLGCKVYYAKINSPSLKGFIKTSLSFNNFLKSHHYDIVMCHSCQSRGILKGTIGARMNGHPIVIGHAHGFDQLPNTVRGNIESMLYPIALRLANDFCFACSNEVGKSKFGNSFINSNNCGLIKNAINVDDFKFSKISRDLWRKKIGAKDNTIVIGNVGRFAIEKNHEFMLSIFNEFNKEHENSLLVFVGDGALKEKVKQKSIELGVSKKVIFLGSHTDVNDIINSFDVFLFPSMSEGLGYVLVESQANGLPCVISSDVIPNEVDMNLGLLKRVSLSLPAKEWADSCYEAFKKGRIEKNKCINAINKNNYNIIAQSELMDEFFQEILNKKQKHK